MTFVLDKKYICYWGEYAKNHFVQKCVSIVKMLIGVMCPFQRMSETNFGLKLGLDRI